jgi:YggT family protein
MDVIGLLVSLLNLYGTLILIYVILGWFVMGNRGGALMDVYRMLGTLCEPYLGLFRRILPPVMIGAGGLDLSPLIGLIVLQFISGAIARIG